MPTPTSRATPATRILRYAAFTDDPAGGNPAGVVLEADELSDAEMQRIATVVGYSETAFVIGLAGHPDADLHIRYFSPRAEVDFCGHATIATAVAVGDVTGSLHPINLMTNVGRISVELEARPGRGPLATLISVPGSARRATNAELGESLAALGWSRADLHPDYPAAIGFAGNDHLIVPVATRERLADLDYDFDALAAIMARASWTTVHLTWSESSTVWHARDPFPPGGIREDPATGAAAAAFGAYLRTFRLVPLPADIVIHQGVDLGRPSLLRLHVAEDDPRLRVSGAAVALPG